MNNWGSHWGSSLRLTLVKNCQRSNVDLTPNVKLIVFFKSMEAQAAPDFCVRFVEVEKWNMA